jgi:hypothetical protein
MKGTRYKNTGSFVDLKRKALLPAGFKMEKESG